MLKELQAVRPVLPLLRRYPWALPAIVTLGTLAALSEGVGISLIIPLFSVLDGGAQPAASSTYTKLLEGALGGVGAERRLLWIPVLIFATVLVKNCLAYANQALLSWTGSQVGHQLRSGLFNQLLRVDYSFLERTGSGKLLDTLANESWRTGQALSLLVGLVITCCTVAVFVALLLLISWEATAMAAAAVLIISTSIGRATRRVGRLGEWLVTTNADLANRMLAVLSTMRVIRIFGREAHEQNRFDRASEQVRRALLRLELLSSAVRPLSEVGYAGIFLAVFVIAAHHSASLPALLAFVVILNRMQPQLRNLSVASVDLVGLAGAVRDVTGLLDRADKPYMKSGAVPFTGLREVITFDAVTFCYNPAAKPALRAVSIRIPRGKTTAIVGPSGAGKTTIINLLFRLYDVSGGEIRVDGIPLPHLTLAAWRERIAFAGQEGHLISGTVRENIAYGRLEGSFEDIVAVAEQANAHEFIRELPQGYDTRVGDGGALLSGGQRQRITLARALLRSPEVLILDEATSELDSISEHRVQSALRSIDCTVILIAHQLPTIAHADQIVVLEDGRVAEQGSFEELLRMNGLFARLSRLQQVAGSRD